MKCVHLLILLLFIGCDVPPPKSYNIEVFNPAGKLIKELTVGSYGEPSSLYTKNESTLIFSPNAWGGTIRKEYPVGYYISIEEELK